MRILYSLVSLLFIACSSPEFIQTSFPEGKYRVKTGATAMGSLHLVNDTAHWITNKKEQYFSDFISQYEKLHISHLSFDLDLFSMPMKLRPAQKNIPTQLNTTFNGGFYVGFRQDHFVISKTKLTPTLQKQTLRRFSIGAGGMLGIGSVFMNPSFLQDAINYEYDAFVIQYGIAGVINYPAFTSGFAIGADWLTDRHGSKWIYQHKPWIGVLFGININ